MSGGGGGCMCRRWVCQGGVSMSGGGYSPPPGMGYNGIQVASRQYASNWNAVLVRQISRHSIFCNI